jgi:predicted dehydrogenase
MKKPDPYRVAMIGRKTIAVAGHIPAFLRHPRLELAGLSEVRPDRLDLA